MQVKFWTQRKIYEHLHSHNLTQYVRSVQDLRRNKILQDELFAGRARVDMVTGQVSQHLPAIREYRQTLKDGRQLSVELSRERNVGSKRFF